MQVYCDGQGVSCGLFLSSMCGFLHFSNLVSDKNRPVSPVTHPSFHSAPLPCRRVAMEPAPHIWASGGFGSDGPAAVGTLWFLRRTMGEVRPPLGKGV